MLHRLIEAAGGAMDAQFPPTGATAEISLPHAVANPSAAPHKRSPSTAGEIAKELQSQTPFVAQL
jgi:hypothetical protein